MLVGRLAGWVTDFERGFPIPTPPPRPWWCPACGSVDICAERPCGRRVDLATDPARQAHDWHCHACTWSVRWPPRPG